METTETTVKSTRKYSDYHREYYQKNKVRLNAERRKKYIVKEVKARLILPSFDGGWGNITTVQFEFRWRNRDNAVMSYVNETRRFLGIWHTIEERYRLIEQFICSVPNRNGDISELKYQENGSGV